MKKMTILLMAMVMSLGLMAQDLPYVNVNGEMPASPKDNEFVCAPGSVFSQVFATYDNAYYAEETAQYSKVADRYTATGEFGSIRFWGANFSGGAINATETFIIRFYELNGGNPIIPGNEVSSYTVSVNPFDMGISAPWGPTPIYQIDIDFGATVTLLDGWVSVSRLNTTDGMTFAMLSLDGSGSQVSYDSSSDIWQTGNDSSLLFCLGNPPPPEVPLSNWALIMSMLLISGFIVIRTRYSAA